MSETSDYQVKRLGQTELILIDRADAFNSLSPELIEALPRLIHAAASDRDCRAIVLTGAGDKAFCAGIDVKSVAAKDSAEPTPDRDPVVDSFEGLDTGLGNIIRMNHKVPVPVIAAVNGHCIGAGLAIASACDLRIGSTNAKFANGFAKRGTSGCEMGTSYFLPRIVGAARALDWMLTGRRVDADEALAAGLLSQVVEPSELVDTALGMANELAAIAPMALAATKEIMWLNLEAPSLDSALALEGRNQSLMRTTGDASEVRRSFLEKRDPEFKPRRGPGQSEATSWTHRGCRQTRFRFRCPRARSRQRSAP